MVSRLLSLTEGSITFDGTNISRMKPDQLARAGLARTFQIVRLVDNLSVLQNVMLGAYCHTTSWLPATGLGLPSVRREEKRTEDDARACLAFTGFDLGEDADVEALPYGKQRIVEIARALTMRPKLLLLDEPAAGLNIQETAQLSRLIREIRGTGITVFLVEHDMSLVMSISDRITVLNYGEILAEGTPHEISGNQQVIDAYLGEVAKC
jgi:branched-chain amino acid transport system ATP-binding protein